MTHNPSTNSAIVYVGNDMFSPKNSKKLGISAQVPTFVPAHLQKIHFHQLKQCPDTCWPYADKVLLSGYSIDMSKWAQILSASSPVPVQHLPLIKIQKIFFPCLQVYSINMSIVDCVTQEQIFSFLGSTTPVPVLGVVGSVAVQPKFSLDQIRCKCRSRSAQSLKC